MPLPLHMQPQPQPEPEPEPEPEPQPRQGPESVAATQPNRVEIDMGEELVKLQEAFELSGAGESGRGDQDLAPANFSGADTSEVSGLAVPLPDDLEPNLTLLLNVLEKEVDANTVEMRNRLQEQLEWLKSQKEQAAAAAAAAAAATTT